MQGKGAAIDGDLTIVDDVAASDVIDFASLERETEQLRERYAAAGPFPHIVLDDVLRRDVFQDAVVEFPPLDETTWTNWVHVNSRKYGNTHADTWPCTLQAIARTLTSDRFVALLEDITGQRDLHADWSMDGGGLHQSVAGGYLNVHADFTSHHTQANWRRRVNVLLYFNREWDEGWGGALEFWSDDMRRKVTSVPPVGNRMIVFTTSEKSYHGHPDPMATPPGVARRSMALYYFVEEERPLTRSTNYRARPGDGLSAASIYLDKQAVHAYDVIKRRFGLPDDAASRLLRSMNRFRRRH